MDENEIKEKPIEEVPLKPIENVPQGKKIILGIVIAVVLVTLLLIIFGLKQTKKQKPHQESQKIPLTVNIAAVSKDSSVAASQNTVLYSLQGYNEPLFKTEASGLNAAYEFINKAPAYRTTDLVPEGFAKEAMLTKSVKDSDDPFIKKMNIQSTAEHYFFDQKIQGIPVFSAQLAIHLRNGNEIYSLDGNLVKNPTVPQQKITEEQAKNIALTKAKSDVNRAAPLAITETKKYIINKKALKESDDETNYLTLAVTVNSAADSVAFGKEYFVDVTNGKIVYEKEIVLNAKNRTVTGSGTTRAEGQAATGNTGIDTAYDLLGQFYDYFYNNFQRDGNNGKGGTVRANVSTSGQQASTTPANATINISTSMLCKDVLFHEDTHILNYNTVGGFNDSAMEEGNSDTWASLIQADWVMVANAQGGVSRNPQNPASAKQPEKLFSTNWKCSGDQHNNGTLIAHTLYLMAKGGTENGCTVTGIGELNAAKIHYQAQTKYMKSSSNYGDIYSAENNACNDLFKQGSAQCIAIQTAMMITEMDQQPAGTTQNPKCSGGSEKKPVCPAAPSGGATSVSPVISSSVANGVAPTNAGDQNTGGTVPSAVCLGNCPTNAPLPTTPVSIIPSAGAFQPSMAIAITQPNIGNQNQGNNGTGNQIPGNNPAGNGGGGSFLSMIMALIQMIINFIMQLFGGGRAH